MTRLTTVLMALLPASLQAQGPFYDAYAALVYNAWPLPEVRWTLPTLWDVDLNHTTGNVTVNQWDVLGPEGVVWSATPFVVTLPPVVTHPGEFQGNSPYGIMTFHSRGVVTGTDGAGWYLSLSFNPRQVIDQAIRPEYPTVRPWQLTRIQIQTPEPKSLSLLLPMLLVLQRWGVYRNRSAS